MKWSIYFFHNIAVHPKVLLAPSQMTNKEMVASRVCVIIIIIIVV